MSSAKKVFSIASKTHGGDSPLLISWQPKQGTYLAVVGSNRTLIIYDRNGQPAEKLPLLDTVANIQWDKDGDMLAAICEKLPIIILWDSNRRKLNQIESSFKDPMTFLTWSKTASILAVGTAKGNLLIYNHSSSKIKEKSLLKNDQNVTDVFY
ncbi:WD repeat-containing 19 [Brachionus plicatilis]|uniref:WD repeat-containing 19 n=1 Tax=Brachionus plicatilis TaxID=10195 RepID=A0A3M7PF15_BRAPC|nr:WD repeat-containing 19 [Brachionus plicatilis]